MCPLLRVDAAQIPRLESIHTNLVIHANLVDRLEEAKEQGWLGEVAAIETTLAAAEQKLAAMRSATAQRTTTALGMPGYGPAVGRSSANG